MITDWACMAGCPCACHEDGERLIEEQMIHFGKNIKFPIHVQGVAFENRLGAEVKIELWFDDAKGHLVAVLQREGAPISAPPFGVDAREAGASLAKLARKLDS